MRAPCVFFGFAGHSRTLTVTLKRYIIFPHRKDPPLKKGEKKTGLIWWIFTWDKKMARYKYVDTVFQDEFETWMNKKGVTWADIGEEPFPGEVSTDEHQPFKVSLINKIPTLDDLLSKK